MRKRAWVYGVLVAALTLYLGFLGICSLDDRVSEANFNGLKIGMTKWEVRKKLGFAYSYSGKVLVKGQVHVNLTGDDGTVMLAFDDEDKLIWKDWVEDWRRQPPERLSWHNLLVRLGYLRIVE